MKVKLGSAVLLSLALGLLGWLAPSPAEAASVKSLQSGTTAMGASTATISLSPALADSTSAFIVCQATSNASKPQQVPLCELTNSSTVTVSLGAAPSSTSISWYVVEFEKGSAFVQRGTSTWSTAAASTATSTTATLASTVNTAESFVLATYTSTANNSTTDEQWATTVQLTNSNTLTFTRGAPGNAGTVTVGYQVVQLDGASVQRGTTTIASGQTTATQTITSVTTSTSFLTMTRRYASGTGGDEAQWMAMGQIASATSLTFTRGTTTNSVTVAWEVVSLANEGTTGQNGLVSASTTASTSVSLASTIDTTRSIPFYTSTINAANTGGLDDASWTAVLTSTQLQLTRVQAASSSVSWFVVQFFKCAAVTDLSYASATTPSTTSVTLSWPSSPAIVLRKTGSAFSSSTEYPVSGNTYPVGAANGPGGTDVVYNSTSAATTTTDTGRTAGTKYFYKVVARSSATNTTSCYAPGAVGQTEVSVTPGQTSITWNYALSGGSMLDGIAGTGKVYPSNNSGKILSVKTADGTWSWTPVATTGSSAIQGWLTWITLKGGTTDVVIAGDQSGKVYVRKAADGTVPGTWADNATGTAIQAGVAVQLWDYSNSAFQTNAGYTNTDIIFAASATGSTATNKLTAIKAVDGTSPWSFNNGGSGLSDMSGQPFVDYARNRVYVATKAASGKSLFIISSLNNTSVACSQTGGDNCILGSLDSSPTLSRDGSTLYVVNTAGDLYAINVSASPPAFKWTGTHKVALASAVNGFVWESTTTAFRLYFSTVSTGTNPNRVWCVNDPGSGQAPPAVPSDTPQSACPWKGLLTGSPTGLSTPLLLDTKIYVGAADGKVHQINLTTGADEKTVDVASTDCSGAACTLGGVSTETDGEIFVGTSGGKLYKIILSGAGTTLPP